LESHIRAWLLATLTKYDDAADGTAMKDAWDAIMRQYDCCGLHSDVSEFVDSPWFL